MFATITIFLLLFSLALLLFLLPLNRLRELRRTIEALTKRIAALERKLQDSETPPASEQAAIPPSPLPAPRQVLDERKLVPPVANVPPPLPPAPPPATPFNWEAFMGVKLFAWLGGLALFLGVVFMVKYSFENNLITPLGRIVIGGTVGLALVAMGWWLARGRYRVTAQSLCATGIVILYADLFAAHSFYALISLTTAFFATSAVTLFSFLLAVNLSAQVIVILGLLGGFLTPVLLPSGYDNSPALFLYIAFLDLGVAAVALRQHWKYLLLLAAVGTALTQIGWAARVFRRRKGGRAFWIFLGFEALFLAICLTWIRLGNQERQERIWLDVGGRRRGIQRARISVSGFRPSRDRGSAAFFFRICFSGGRRFARVPSDRQGAARDRARGRCPHVRACAEWIGLFAAHAPLNVALAAIVIFALLHAATIPGIGLASGRPAPDRRRHGDAISSPGDFDRTGGALESDTGFPRCSHPHRNPAGCRDCEASGLACAVCPAWRLPGGTDLAGGPVHKRAGGPHPRLLRTLSHFLRRLSILLGAKGKDWAWAISALAQALQFWVVYQVITRAFPNEWMGLLPAIFVLPGRNRGVGAAETLSAPTRQGDTRLAWQGGALLLFVSLIFPLQFDREWVTLGWACEGVALLWLFRRLPHRGLRLVAVVLLCAAFVRLALNPAVFEYHKRTGNPDLELVSLCLRDH